MTIIWENEFNEDEIDAEKSAKTAEKSTKAAEKSTKAVKKRKRKQIKVQVNNFDSMYVIKLDLHTYRLTIMSITKRRNQ